MENKNTFIAVALMLLVWAAFTIMFPPAEAPKPVAAVKSEISVPVASTTPPAVVTPAPPLSTPSPAAISNGAKVVDYVIDTPLYRAVVTSSGGRLKEFRLKNYREESSDRAPLVEMVTSPEGTLRLSGDGDLAFPADASFVSDSPSTSINLTADQKGSLKLSLPLPSGAILVREYRFSGKSYDVEHVVSVHNPAQSTRNGRITLELHEAVDRLKDNNTSSDFVGSVTYDGKKTHTDKYESLEKGAKEYSSPVWSAFKSKYFLRAIIPADNLSTTIAVKKSGSTVIHRVQSPSIILSPASSVSKSYLLFFGPTEMEALKVVGHDLEEAVDLGWFAIFGQPLFLFLKFIYGFVGNYGWAIIILTIIIKLCFWPLTNKSYASMKAMQKLQPEMQKLRDKYKNDREKMNLEIMELYKKHRVNPLGGCLPMLVQFPIFIALYNVLMNMIELRHAPFLFWLTDLSVKDPYYVTPLIMGATMFIQQKMSPAQLDPIQQKIFLVMPIVFTFLFLTFPSGLVIYWLVNNVLSIMQQYMINRSND